MELLIGGFIGFVLGGVLPQPKFVKRWVDKARAKLMLEPEE